MTKTAYCNRELCEMLDKAGIDAQHVIAFENESWYKKYTLDVAMRWLREEKHILIFIAPGYDDIGNLTYVADVWIWNLYESHWATADHVYEKALEAAIEYSLKNLL